MSLKDVKGLGKKTLENLNDAGIKKIEDLANSDVKELIKIEGIGKKSAKNFIENAKDLIEESEIDDNIDDQGFHEEFKEEEIETAELSEEEIKKAEEERKKEEERRKKQEEKRKRLEETEIEEGDFILVKITGKTQRGNVFRVSSVEDAKKAGIYDEQKEKQGHYTPEFVVVGKPGFLNEGLMETIEKMKYFEKKSVRIPPVKAFGKRDPAKIERIGLAKFRRMNDGKPPEIGQEFTRQTQQGAQRGTVTNFVQGKVIVDYNHPLAGQNVDYNVEIVDKIEEFDEKIEYFMVNKGIPPDNINDFEKNYIEEDKTLEITIPKMFLFQNMTYLKFGLAMDFQTHMADQIEDVKFIEVYEKMPTPQATEDSVMKKVKEFNKEQEVKDDVEEEQQIEENLEE
ncbi:MAG: hypothetical protein GF317_06830 [Candidatus Lokiarchaeota archaeon]|nr:hypothetical protein [Candidatus Lokiarchaeota archaeon]MBD3199424.1 hypothetical protein [Candidatus Lokiarchaeota archaeon]